MILFDEGKLVLDEKVTHYLPTFGGGDKDLITVRELLEHRSGLPAGRDLWRHAHTPEEARQLVSTPRSSTSPTTVRSTPISAPTSSAGSSSPPAGMPLDRFLADRVFTPLGMNDTGFRPADSLVYRIAPTEVSRRRADIRFAAKCTMKTRSRSAESRAMPDCSAPRATSRYSRR